MTPDPKIAALETQFQDYAKTLNDLQMQVTRLQQVKTPTPSPAMTPDPKIAALETQFQDYAKTLNDLQMQVTRLQQVKTPTPSPAMTPDPKIAALETQFQDYAKMLNDLQTQVAKLENAMTRFVHRYLPIAGGILMLFFLMAVLWPVFSSKKVRDKLDESISQNSQDVNGATNKSRAEETSISIHEVAKLNQNFEGLSQSFFDIRHLQSNIQSIPEQFKQFDDRIRALEQSVFSSWCIIGKSVIGKSHIQGNIPCQDAQSIEPVDSRWGVAVVCDGAGSAKLSHIGSEFVAQQSAKLFKKLVIRQAWNRSQILPSHEEWHTFAKEGFIAIREELDDYAKQNRYEIASLACTSIVVIYSPIGILLSHIGDGRAAYRTMRGEWKAIMVPWKGNEPNETVFLTSSFWHKNLDDYIESRVIVDKIAAFAIMSDGCEKHAFECSIFDKKTEKWSDPNQPYPKFFEPLFTTLVDMRTENAQSSEIEAKWKAFLEAGTSGLTNEPDDKTMILGVLS